jgi:putative pantetheine hydrolase
VVLDGGFTVAALVAVNSFGDVCEVATGELLARRSALDWEFGGLGIPTPAEAHAARERALAAYREQPVRPGMATVVGVIGTDAPLTKAQCQKVSGIGHDGLARAIDPVHTLLDGDTLFTLAAPSGEPLELPTLHAVLVAAAGCVTRAVGHAILAADSVDNGTVDLRSYRDAFPSAFDSA